MTLAKVQFYFALQKQIQTHFFFIKCTDVALYVGRSKIDIDHPNFIVTHEVGFFFMGTLRPLSIRFWLSLRFFMRSHWYEHTPELWFYFSPLHASCFPSILTSATDVRSISLYVIYLLFSLYAWVDLAFSSIYWVPRRRSTVVNAWITITTNLRNSLIT